MKDCRNMEKVYEAVELLNDFCADTAYKSNNERKRNKEPMIREKAYIRVYRNKCRRRNVREIHTLDRKVQKEEV